MRRLLRALLLGLYTSLLLTTPLASAPPRQITPSAIHAPLTPAFTYQGRLEKGGELVTASCAMTFSLFDAATAGTKMGNGQTINPIDVNEGLFTVSLNGSGEFGANAFDGGTRFLEISVLCSGDASAVTLPRQQLTAAPYAITSLSTQGLQGRPVSAIAPTTGQALAWNGSEWTPQTLGDNGPNEWGTLSGIPSGFADNVDDEGPTPDWNDIANLPTDFADEVDNDSGGDITGVAAGNGLTGGGLSGNVSLALDTAITDNLYWRLDGNAAVPTTGFFGTTDRVMLTLATSNTTALRLLPSIDLANGDVAPTLIGGHSTNNVAMGVAGAIIAGGGRSLADDPNLVFDNYGAILGGVDNIVGSGDNDPLNASFATIVGGVSNQASAELAFIGGGSLNKAAGEQSVVGGGSMNETNASFATIPGGEAALATLHGQFAYAAGAFGDGELEIGSAQSSIYLLRNEGVGSLFLFLDGEDDSLLIRPGTSIVYSIFVVGRSTTATEFTVAYRIDGAIYADDNGTTVSFPAIPNIITIGETNFAGDLNASASATEGTLRINVENSTGQAMRWVATVYTTEVAEE